METNIYKSIKRAFEVWDKEVEAFKNTDLESEALTTKVENLAALEKELIILKINVNNIFLMMKREGHKDEQKALALYSEFDKRGIFTQNKREVINEKQF